MIYRLLFRIRPRRFGGIGPWNPAHAERAHWPHPFHLTCSWSRVKLVPSRNGTWEFARVLEVNRPQERSFPMSNSARSILTLGMLVFSPWVLAQGDLGSISGMVSNTDHAIVASAPIQVKSLETGATYKATSSSTGNYNLSQLPAGTYDLFIVMPGFATYRKPGIVIQAGQKLRLDVQLADPQLNTLSEGNTPAFRQIFLDRDHPADLDPTWLGHSTGKWDGDTLVVDTIGFNDKAWIAPGSFPHSEKLQMTTRIRRPDLGHLEFETTYEDTGTFTRPWKVKQVADLAPGEEIWEYICNENNQDAEHMTGK